jgi:hypothetical protein
MPTTMIQSQVRQTILDQATYTDSVSKMRVSTPESLIDTDFEYGLQSIKWETLQTVNNIPTFYSVTGDIPLSVTDIQSRSNIDYIYVYLGSTSANTMTIGSPIIISGLTPGFITAEGNYLVNRVITSNIIAYRSKQIQTYTGSIYNPASTLIYPGKFYTGTQYSLDQLASITTNGTNTITVNTLTPHGFSSNTYFNLINSIGRKITAFDGSLITGNSIYSPGHDLPDFALITYSNISGATVSGLTNGASYYAFNSSFNTFQLSSNTYPGSLIGITATGSSTSQSFYSTDNATDSSTYFINSIPSSSSFTLNVGSSIPVTTYTFLPRNVLNMQCNCINFGSSPHQYPSGAPFVYNTLGNSPIYGNGSPLVSGNTYYAIRQDAYNLGISTTPQYLPPYSMMTLDYPNASSGSNSIILTSIAGERFGINSAFQPFTASNVIYASNVNVQTLYKPGDICRIENPGTTIVYNTVTATLATGLLTGGTPSLPTTISTGTYCIISNLSTPNGLTNNFGYYLRYNGSTGYNLYNRYSDAINNTNAVAFNTAATATITLTLRTPGNFFESQVTSIGSSSKFTTASIYTGNYSGTYLKYIQRTGLYPRMDGYAIHRAFDGGIELTPPTNSDAQIIRQTRRNFRYQPGKGIQISLSVNFSAPIDIDIIQTVVSNSSTALVTTKNPPHRLTPGLNVIIDTVKTQASTTSTPNTYPINPSPPWTGNFTITSCPTPYTFTYTMSSNLTVPTIMNGLPIAYINGWTGSKIRVGMFDDQNGMFFEYDGINIYAVRRDAVTQISGKNYVMNGSSAVFGTLNTNYTSQLTIGTNIVIRGQTYKVSDVPNNTTFYIQPAYRGVTSSNVIISLITDTKTVQSSWNIDPCNGTGVTGYNLDIHKIQMIYFDYSWYGAGKIRYGFKDTTGIVRYVHEYIHNNNSLTAYFRSGNLPCRYEVNNVGTPSWVPSLLHWGTSVIMDGRYDDDKAYLFTASGNVIQFTAGDTIQCYATAGSTANSLYTGNTTLTNFNVTTNLYDSYQQSTVSAYSIYTTAQSAGGLFSSNVSYKDVQNIRSGTPISGSNIQTGTVTLSTAQRGTSTGYINGNIIYTGQIFINKPVTGPMNWGSITFGSTTDIIPTIIPLVSIRLAPSVDSSITGALGVRELINKMMLRLRSIDLLTTNDTECRIYLNATLDNTNWVANTIPSLSQLITHNKNDGIQGGVNIFSFRVPGGSTDANGKRSTTVTTQDLNALGSIQNSILGGNNVYPDGPDVLTVAAVCLDSAGVSATTPYIVSSRISFYESQS